MLQEFFLFGLGTTLLVFGAWLVVTAGSRIAALLGIAPVVIGLTVVAWGTSAPELFVSLVAAWRGNAGLMFGNVVGSNVANVGLILGLAVTLSKVAIDKELIRLEVPLLLAATGIFYLFALDGRLQRLEGAVLMAGLVLFMGLTLRSARSTDEVDRATTAVATAPATTPAATPAATGSGANGQTASGRSDKTLRITRQSLLVVVGVGGLTAGGHLICVAAVDIAERFGASEALIGLLLVAVGTSLPELATTVVAALRGESDLALGNIIGSNLFNLLGVAGPAVLIRPVVIPEQTLHAQLAVMTALTLMVPLIIFKRRVVSRWWGPVLLAAYSLGVVFWLRVGI